MAVMLIEEVLVASTIPPRQTRSRAAKISRLGVHVFRGGLDHEVDRLQIAAVEIGGLNPGHRPVALLGASLSLSTSLASCFADEGTPALGDVAGSRRA
jgi:hypothetical protein